MMSDSPQASFVLVMRRGPQPDQRVPLNHDVITLGRAPGNDIVVPNEEVSRYHARLTRQGDQWVLQDLESRNGTFVNGQRITAPVVLAAGSQVTLGPDVLFAVELHSISEAHSARRVQAGTFPAAQVRACRPQVQTGRAIRDVGRRLRTKDSGGSGSALPLARLERQENRGSLAGADVGLSQSERTSAAGSDRRGLGSVRQETHSL